MRAKQLVAGALSAFAILSAPVAASADEERAQAEFKGRHVMQGEVRKIDKEKSLVTIRTDDKNDLTLHFPQTALEGVKKGDRISVEMALRAEREGGSTKEMREPEPKAPYGQ